MKKHFLILAAACCACVGVGDSVRAQSPSMNANSFVLASTVGALNVGSDAVRATSGDVRALCERAKKEYSAKYSAEATSARETLIGAIAEYGEYASKSQNPFVTILAKKLDAPKLLTLAKNDLDRFYESVKEVEPLTTSRAEVADKGFEKERALSDAMLAYLAAADDSASNAEQTEDGVPLEQAVRDYFNENCDKLASVFGEYLEYPTDESADALKEAFGEIHFYQPGSPTVVALNEALRARFAEANLHIEASQRFVSAMTRRNITEKFTVQEYIREAFARGTGVAQGVTSLQFRPNAERAEMAVTLNAKVSTRTIGSSRGVNVHTDNGGTVVATKPIYINSNGVLTTSASTAYGNMKSNVNSIDSDRLMLLGGAIIQNKVYQELPYSERESADRLSQRVAKELDEQANGLISQLNRRILRMTAAGADPMIRKLSTKTTDSRIFVSCVLGRSRQFAAPILKHKDPIEAYLERGGKGDVGIAWTRGFAPSELVASQTNELYGQNADGVMLVNSGMSSGQSFGLASGVMNVLSAPREMASHLASALSPMPSEQPVAPQYASSQYPTRQYNATQVQTRAQSPAYVSEKNSSAQKTAGAKNQTATNSRGERVLFRPVSTSKSSSEADVVVKLHQSGPNNAVTVALAGAVFGPGADTIDDVIARFPAVDAADIKSFLVPYEPKDEKELDPEDSAKNVFIRFDDVRPFATTFDGGKICTLLKIASCTVDDKEWPPVEVEFIYSLEKRGDSYAFVRELVDVRPDGYQDGDAISARFHTFRRIFMKRLELTIQDEYVVAPIVLDDPNTGEKRGALLPEKLEVEDGWFVVEFKYDPYYQAK